VLRRGDVNVNCRIILHVNHSPERFRVLPPLADMISVKEGTRAEVMAAVWKLVKVAGAQDKDDGLKRQVGTSSTRLTPDHLKRLFALPPAA
jgi:SWI/SNF-related matrix-associated actin-dependent regulator of chromatin subfamily D